MKRYIQFKLFFDGGRGEKHETHENFNYFPYTDLNAELLPSVGYFLVVLVH